MIMLVSRFGLFEEAPQQQKQLSGKFALKLHSSLTVNCSGRDSRQLKTDLAPSKRLTPLSEPLSL